MLLFWKALFVSRREVRWEGGKGGKGTQNTSKTNSFTWLKGQTNVANRQAAMKTGWWDAPLVLQDLAEATSM